MNLRQLELALLQVIDDLTGRLPDSELQDMRELTTAGEPGVAFENLCVQLYEHGLSVEPRVWDSLRHIGTAMDIDPDVWDRLRPGV